MNVIIDREDIINHFTAKLGVCNSEIELSFEGPTGANLNTTKVRMALANLWDEAQRLARGNESTIPHKISLIGAVRDICPQSTLAEGKDFVEETLLRQI